MGKVFEIKISTNKGNAFLNYIYDNAYDIVHQAIEKSMPRILRDQEKIIKSAIEKYYSVPKRYYKRTKSLFKVYKMDDYGFEFSPEFMPNVHRVSNEYIYDKMFIEGYHGGATKGPDDLFQTPIPWEMAYRRPVRIFGKSDLPAFSLWSFTQPRKSNPSPNELIDIGLEKYEPEGIKIIENEFIKILGGIRKRVMS